MPKRILILAGAPSSRSLDWSSSSLHGVLDHEIARFVGLPGQTPDPASSYSVLEHARWRSLPLAKPGLRVPEYATTTISNHHPDLGLLPPDESEDDETTNFLAMADVPPSDPDDPTTIFSQFCERSLAAHDAIPSSQLDLISTQDSSSFLTSEESTSFRSTQSLPGPRSSHPPQPRQAVHAHLTNLADMPSAAYLDRIHPQTATVNLVVGVMSIAAPRRVETRYGGARVLVEVLVGDDTRRPFCITFWLAENVPSPVDGLRLRDVVLLRHVGLHAFRGKVYGQSLRRGLTRVHLLHRRRLHVGDVGGCYSSADLARADDVGRDEQLRKASKVGEWLVRFVGDVASGDGGKGKGAGPAWMLPPPHDDTQ